MDAGFFIHRFDPVLLPIRGPIAIRWYGLSYLLGFLAVYFLLRFLSRRGLFAVPPGEIQNFVVQLAFFGVFLGGRLGYALFYNLPETLADPLSVLRVWEGGMASHGGMLGVILFMAWYARAHRAPFWNLADGMACTAPVGLAFGRLANFINGELWGRPTRVPWAVLFPTEAGYPAGADIPPAALQTLIETGRVQPRHPSQLYEMIGEGALLFAVLWILRLRPWSRVPGRLSAAFLALYAVARIAAECFREPDSTVFFGGVTKGQLFSLLMLPAAAAVWWRAHRARIPEGNP
jgi:phosphatidylglycerol---prolipoprotein diacylglyceryl transferase